MNKSFFTSLKSMTGFGRAFRSSSWGVFVVEVHTVNRKHLEIQLQLPRGFSRFEREIRSCVEAYIHRGHAIVNLQWTGLEGSLQIVPNLSLAQGLAEAWKKIEKAAGLSLDPSPFFCQQRELILVQEKEVDDTALTSEIKSVLQEALKALVEERKTEGQRLALDIQKRLVYLKEALGRISLKAPSAVDRYREKLKEKLESFPRLASDNEEKLLREIALYADKVDVTEEIVRANGHIEQCFSILQAHEDKYPEGAGKLLEFMAQELMRECNTLGAKVSDLECVQEIVQMKVEVEKIREQLQNIE